MRVNSNKHRVIVRKLMEEKLRDSKGKSIELRRDKKNCLEKLEHKMGKGSKVLERIKREIKDHVSKVKLKLRERNESKVRH